MANSRKLAIACALAFALPQAHAGDFNGTVSAIGRLGWQLAYDAGRWQPYARVSLDHELHDPERDVNAQLVSAPNLPSFSMPAVRVGRDAVTVLAGAGVRLAPRWTANAGISHSASSKASTTGAFATLSASF